MLGSFLFSAAIGSVLGILAGLGVGGGSLLILWLSLVLHMPQQTAQGINLLFFLPAAVISCLLRHKQGNLSIRKVLPAIIAGAVGAAVFSYIGNTVNTDLLRKPFGVLLLITGLRELFYRPRNAR